MPQRFSPQPLLLGLATGARSSLGMAAVTLTARGPLRLSVVHPDDAYRRPRNRKALIALAAVAGEIIVDKLPVAPSRLKPAPFAARLVLGAGAAAIAGRRANLYPRDLARWAGSGLIGAAVGSVGGRQWRRTASSRFGFDLPGAVIEDFVALTLSTLAVAPYGRLRRRMLMITPWQRASRPADVSGSVVSLRVGPARNPGIRRSRVR